MTMKGARLPKGNNRSKIIVICTEEQEEYIRKFGCIACNDDICDCGFCERCCYEAENIEYRRQ